MTLKPGASWGFSTTGAPLEVTGAAWASDMMNLWTDVEYVVDERDELDEPVLVKLEG